jgi:NADPH2:quinone reductase
MRAMVVDELGGPLRVAQLPEPEPGPGQVTIAVRRAGVNFPDMLIMQGRYQLKPPVPFAPGFEVAGEVLAVGPDETRFTPGDRVMASLWYGGYAEVVAVDEARVFALPDGVSDDQAAVVPIAYGTSYHALADRAHLESGETLVVLGASGGVGLATVEIGAMLGARVIGCVGAEWKGEAVRRQGAEHIINTATEDVRSRVLEITDGNGADVVYDPVGGEATEIALRYLAWRGRLLIIGFTSGRIPDLAANRLLLKGAAAVGVYWGQFAELEPAVNRANFDMILSWIADGTLQPFVSERYPLEDAGKALAALAERRAVGKLVLEVS